jgi:CHRD domain-containing protein
MNRRALIALFACVLVTGCGDDDGPTSPSGAPLVFSALLSPANEVPPVGNAESGGRGAVQVTFSGGTADFYFQVSAFPGDTRVVGAHIHPAPAGVNGPVLVGTPLTAAAPFLLSNGTGEYRVSGIAVSQATLDAIVANPGAFYFNVHSPLNPGGFARGQLTRVQ